KAKKNHYRNPDKTLLLSALATAGLGALLGGQLFHHNTRKWYFWLTWICGIIIEIVVLYYIWRSKNGWKIDF
ncbi:DUF1294 domain-containing protein, partial [Streptococcus gordonii]|uniref:DUF1294 domain-containing protein n=1 Tax=Streptococcus gordonii TaxID=1302 RepID=UPI0023AE9073